MTGSFSVLNFKRLPCPTDKRSSDPQTYYPLVKGNVHELYYNCNYCYFIITDQTPYTFDIVQAMFPTHVLLIGMLFIDN